MSRNTNVKQHPRQLKTGRTKVKRHKRRINTTNTNKPPKRKLDPHLSKKSRMTNIEKYNLQKIIDQNDSDTQLIDLSLAYDENLDELRSAGLYIEQDHNQRMKEIEKIAVKEQREAERAYVEYEVLRKHENRSPAAIQRDENMRNKNRVSMYRMTPEEAQEVNLSRVDVIGIDDPEK